MSDDGSGSSVYREEPGGDPGESRAAAGTARVSIGKEPADEPHPATSGLPGGDQGAVRARRFWSGRRLPAALTAAVVLGASGLFLYDIASVRADRKAMHWRVKLADELATRHLDDVWIILGASVAAALGLWLLVLALTPGERGVLPMARAGSAGVRAGLDRRAAELVLRDRAMEVAGVRWARVDVGRRKIKTRATSHFRELEDVRTDLTAALGEAVRHLGLARTPQVSIHLQRAEKKG